MFQRGPCQLPWQGPWLFLEGCIAPGDSLTFESELMESASDRRVRSEAGLEAFLSLAVTPWSFEPEDAVHAGDIRAELEKAGTPIGYYDYLIAEQARCRGAALVTLNQREFERVPGLIVVNWTA